MPSSVILEYQEAEGAKGTTTVHAPILGAVSLLLVAKGADEICVPAPTAEHEDMVQRAIADLPRERRHLIRVVDAKGETLRRVREYLAPLRSQATKWPEDAFVWFAETFLYQAAIAHATHSSVVEGELETLRGFIPILDTRVFQGEAAYRLADIVSIVASYEPTVAGEGVLNPHADIARVGRTVDEILHSAEFHAFSSVAGGLGLALRPSVAIEEMIRRLKALLNRPSAQQALTLGRTAADLAGAGVSAEATSRLLGSLEINAGPFRPPFIGLGATSLGLYRVALFERYPDAVPPPGTIMMIQHYRGGKSGVSWLNEGEGDKLSREADESMSRKLESAKQARAALNRFGVVADAT